MIDSRLARRLQWLLLFRLLAVVSSLASLYALEGPLRLPRHAPPYWTLSAGCVVCLVYLLWARSGRALRGLAMVQILGDLLLVGLLVYFTGFQKLFALLYFAVVLSSTAILETGWGLLSASISTLMLSSIYLLYFFAYSGYLEHPIVLPWVDPLVKLTYTNELSFRLPYLFFFSLSLHVVAILAGRLKEEASRVRILNDEILKNMAGGVVAVDRQGIIAFINPQAVKILGIDPGRSSGLHYREVLPERVSHLIVEAIQGGRRIQRTLGEGTPSLMEVTISLLHDERTQQLRGLVAILNDVTMRQRLEEAQQRAEQFRSLLEMSAGMAHEIRNPLASIRGAAQELRQARAATDTEERQLLEVVMRESDRLNKIIGDFLEYAGEKPLNITICDLSQVLRDVALLVESRADTKRVKIELQLPEEALCSADENQLKQLFLNLAINGVEAFSHEGTLILRCAPRTSHKPEDDRPGFLVEVVDNGTGIKPGDLSRIFDPFFTTKPQGTGIGLAIARRVVQAHEGTIEIDSKPGRGTVCRVWLPA